MNRLFIHLYLDENIDSLVAKILRARGYQVLTTDEAKRKGKSDPEQMTFAVENELAIATMNRVDFESIGKEYFYSARQHFGIFIVADKSPQEIAQKLSEFLDFITADEMMNQIVYV